MCYIMYLRTTMPYNTSPVIIIFSMFLSQNLSTQERLAQYATLRRVTSGYKKAIVSGEASYQAAMRSSTEDGAGVSSPARPHRCYRALPT